MEESETVTPNAVLEFIHNLTSINDSHLIQTSATNEYLTNYLSNYTPDSLYLLKFSDDGYHLSNDLQSFEGDLTKLTNLIILIKQKGQLISKTSLIDQINIINIPMAKLLNEEENDSNNESFEKLRFLINLGISPYFDLLTNNSNNESSFNITKKKFNELSLSLQHLQQKIQIPDLIISTHPKIVQLLNSDKINEEEEEEESLIHDTVFLNELTNIVNNWIKQIQSITNLNHNPLDGDSILEEIQFWKSMELALLSINQQILSAEVKNSIKFLNESKRFHITLSFQNDIGLNDKLNETKIYNSLLKDLPIDDLIHISNNLNDSSNLIKFESAIINIFNHLKKLKNLNSFPIIRSIELIELVLNDLTKNFYKILSNYSLMTIDFNQFIKIYNNSILKIFNLIDSNIKFMINLIRELLRKRQEKFIIVKINQDSFNELRDKIQYLMNFRLKHENLLTTLSNLLPSNIDFSNKIIDTYNKVIIPINPLDLSNHGKLIWNQNENTYLECFNNLENLIIDKLNSIFNNCNNFNDFISIFNKFKKFNTINNSNNLLSLISDELKLKILSIVNKEFEKLVELNLKKQNQIVSFFNSKEFNDPIISKIIWNLSLTNKLNNYLIYLKLLLGSNWNKYSLGNKLDLEISSLIDNLNPDKIFNKWLDDLMSLSSKNNYKFNFSGPIIKIDDQNSESLDLIVNFDSNLINLSNQLNHLSSFGFKIPVNLLIQFKKINRLHPFIVTLIEHIEILRTTSDIELEQTNYGKKFGFLLEYQKQIILLHLKEVLSIDWIHISQAYDLQNISNDSKENDSIDIKNEDIIEIKSLNNLTIFQDEIYKLYSQSNKILRFYQFLYNDKLPNLLTCDFSQSEINKVIDSIQAKIIKLSYENFNDFDKFIQIINGDIQNVLIEKCQQKLNSFNEALISSDSSDVLPKGNHSILFQNQSFILSPPLEDTKQAWYSEFNKFFDIIENQSRIQIDGKIEKFKITSNSSITVDILRNLKIIDELMNNSLSYFEKWLVLENLWDLDLNTDDEFNKLFGNVVEPITIDDWLQVFNKIINLRSLFDRPENFFTINNYLQIDFAKVQSRTVMKFDNFQNTLLNKFALSFQIDLINFNNDLLNARNLLEPALNIQMMTPKLITVLENHFHYKTSINSIQEKISSFNKGQTLLQKRKFKAPQDWIFVEQLENNFSIVKTLLERKDKIIEANNEIIVSKVKSEAIKINEEIKKLIGDWFNKKPISGNLNPSNAITNLIAFEDKVGHLDKSKTSVLKISSNLKIPIEIEEDLFDIVDEIEDLKSVWSSINTLWEDLERVKSSKWSEVQPRILRRQLDDVLMNSRSLPTKVRQYAAFDEIQNLIKSYLKNFSYINDLKSDAMKKHHWKQLLDLVGFEDLIVESLKVGDVFNLNFQLNETIIKSILVQANNEQTIEDNLLLIKKEWSTITFEMFNYENKCRLIKNWDKLFDQCDSDLNTLASMKNSAYYSNFEQKIISLEDQLNRLFILLDTWIDVQRQWVYLDGVFGNKNNDMKNLLPVESTRFTNITYEFFGILKKANKYNLVLDVLLISDIQPVMDKFLESLVKVRKSLTDYLEKQRELFPRFYFVGNEDLLEIIGSAIDINRINKHFKKMFSGITSVDYQNESSTIVAINSEQEEKLQLSTPVSLIKYPRLNEWLRELELEIKFTLSKSVKNCLKDFTECFRNDQFDGLRECIKLYSTQVLTLTLQIFFTSTTEKAISDNSLAKTVEAYGRLINVMSTLISSNSFENKERKKLECLVIEMLHERDILSSLHSTSTQEELQSIWNVQQLFYYNSDSTDLVTNLKVKQAGAEFTYGYEYLGIPDKLAYTPLIDKCFLAMTQALDQRLGGSPFGPAGTGKTESVKALGNNLGKMVLVFCCDEAFDFQSMGRIFLGLCKVGCWGCFDEFNRLDSRILSAVSSQIENIELGLSGKSEQIEISGKSLTVNPETGIFVTMNPGYVGRYELPENLKKLFRNFSMEKADSEIIADVLLTSQGFVNSRKLASIVVPFFIGIEEKTSKQSHYDFGLRTLKSTLNKCGLIMRSLPSNTSDSLLFESKLVLQSIRETIAPKLIKEDEVVLLDLIDEFFPNVSYDNLDHTNLMTELESIAKRDGLTVTENWANKCLQLSQMQSNHHGLMLVGSAGSGKSVIYKLVLEALSKLDGSDYLTFVIDCKVISKDEIYGYLDVVTRDWTDGLFTSILRRIKSNLRGELSKRIWIVFDGDIDPEWAENLNSVLDDNKLLTLPNGERLELPPNIRLLFEVNSLKYTTLATISRCGMIWFDSSLVSTNALFNKFTHELSTVAIDLDEEYLNDISNTEIIDIQKSLAADILNITSSNLFSKVAAEAENLNHIMPFTIHRVIGAFCTLLKVYCRRFVTYRAVNKTIPIDGSEKYIKMAIILSFIWSFAGGSSLSDREEFGRSISSFEEFNGIDELPDKDCAFIDYDISLPECQWVSWTRIVGVKDLEPQHITNPNTVVPTLDTVRHESLIYSVLNEHKTLLLCGPPGSGKTMTLLEALRKSPNLDVLPLNFSKDTTPKSMMTSLEQYCHYKKTNNGVVLTPKVNGKWVVVFCDEINLPGVDKYGTQRVISLLRQMVENGGFWKVKDKQWVTLSNVQFVGACNSPNDPGRHPLSDRLLRHVSLIMVDYPGKNSLRQIYQSFTLAVLKCAPDLRTYSSSVTDAMIEIYQKTKDKLTSELQDHYIYSPRELTRWTRGILEALRAVEYQSLDDLIRLWYHEGLRLFYDRLVKDEERDWTKTIFKQTIEQFFPNIDVDNVTREPVLYSNWLTSKYEPVDEVELRSFVSERLRVFSDEEIDVNLVLYGDLLDHSLRIDRVLRQPQGHMILVGPCTSGKTTLAKFVAWINGLKIIQLNVSRKYTLEDFDATLRSILLRCANGEKVCFLIDESSILETSFIERMNTLLANAEIPGLFEGDDYSHLMNLCTEQSHSQGLLLDSNEELYEWFTKQISENLHVVFTISDMQNSNKPQVISSPALFNRCVLSWMGDWSNNSLFEIGSRLIEPVPLDLSSYSIPESYDSDIFSDITGFRDVIVEVVIFFHRVVIDYESTLNHFKTPSQFMALIKNFIEIFTNKQYELEENQRHISIGLDKLRETVIQVNELKHHLSKKKEYLALKDQEAKTMLNKMLTDQNEAERKQEFSVATQEELSKQEVEIEMRRSEVMKDLELAEPAVIEAQRGVQNIKKQHLTEIRSMSNPPAAVKMTMEAVCILIGYEVSSWRDVQLIVRRDDFIANIVSFDNLLQLTPDVRRYMDKVYLSREGFNFETVNRASKACGPLLQWVQAQMAYSSILESVGPLRDEVIALEAQTKNTKAQLIAVDEMIHELEDSIEKYKDSYSGLIREAENIKLEMSSVEKKVNRSMKLIDNLTSERYRWKSSIDKFGIERERLIGNSLLAAAFLVYAGTFDQKGRELLISKWKLKLTNANIPFDNSLSVSGYLANGGEILRWQNSGLTSDTLNFENFTIMKSTKIPLIIDPSSLIVNVITESNLPKKTTVTSFLNESFVKQLENSLRFGGIILIKDAEYYDPILDPVLRHEVHRNGGRMVVKLGDQEIDFSENFKLILFTKDSLIALSSFVAARTSVVNFTVTSGSLEDQILNTTLQFIRPDIQEKRNQLVSSKGEYKVRLYNLEEELLASLSDTSGNILDNDYVVETLERLKAEATEIDYKISESDEVMATVDEVRNKYDDVAKHSVKIFNVLKSLTSFNKFYAFSLDTYTSIFTSVLKSRVKNLEIEEFIKELYKETFSVVIPSLRYSDKISFSLGLLLSFQRLEIGQQFAKTLLTIFKAIINKNYDKDFKKILIESIAGFDEGSMFESEEEIESVFVQNPENETLNVLKPLIQSLRKCNTERKDAFMDAFIELCSFLFTGSVPFSSKYELKDWVKENWKPILLASPEGYDATFKVEQLANELNEKLVIVSMGSKEGVEIANKEIDQAMKKNNWVLIQNIQMSTSWLNFLEKKIENVSIESGFRIFMTCNLLSNNIPIGLINSSKVLTFENQPGLKNVVSETFKSIPNELMKIEVSEFRHVCFLLVWYHSVIQERLRYSPISFTQLYDINDSDFTAGLTVIKKLFEPLISKGRTNVDPNSIPWHELQYLIGEITYGGKINVKSDFEYFVKLSKALFKVESFENDFNLIDNELSNKQNIKLKFPEGISTGAYTTWISKLPNKTPLSWIGLEEEVDVLVRESEGQNVASKAIEFI